ncbi:MAG TPA: prepilin-type N-terminal cleavage/methylation domain-containing protein [Oligoflexus sp.]|uniref:prepilin-type N-terminal cleavage/methylation domain-containing protein n=1 Tax=Oligoflexus sp. TaxID=1971216 RepID=UPI002D809D0C|nr:prepilin-type N-terminal cleavage/methylation domain-containing protein [Oligoflexus sp.]HET9239489.1 prepilin-type N-terminal cleavage/methylation domain-containing protein [Oligoflexus sp.]
MKATQSKEAGFSLVETLVSLVLLSLVGYFVLVSQNKAQKAMFKGTSRDAHAQIVSVVKSKTGKALEKILASALISPGGLAPLFNSELAFGEGIRLKWAKPSDPRKKTVIMDYVSNPDKVAQEALESCRQSKTYIQAWTGQELPQRLASQNLTFCGQMIMPANPDSNYGAQNIAQAKVGFVALDVSFTKVIDGSPIPLSQFGVGGTLATVTWTMLWSYEKGQENVQQFRKGIYHIVP